MSLGDMIRFKREEREQYGFLSMALWQTQQAFAVISMILVFAACFMFIFGYYADPENET